jgi:hypothetical protein
LAINITLVLKVNVISNFAASAAFNSDSANLLKANIFWEKTLGGTGDDRAFYVATVWDGYMVIGSSPSLERARR